MLLTVATHPTTHYSSHLRYLKVGPWSNWPYSFCSLQTATATVQLQNKQQDGSKM